MPADEHEVITAHEIEDILSRLASETSPPGIFGFGGAVAVCLAIGCPELGAVHVDHVSGVHRRVDLTGFEFVARRGPVSVAQRARVSERAGHSFSDRSLGGWMDHGFFLVETVETMDADRPSEFVYWIYSMGDAGNTNPDVSVSGRATWSGIMSGVFMPRSRDAGSFVNGDAILTVTRLDPASGVSIDVEFGNVVHEDTGAEVGDMAWKGLTLTDGGFGAGHVVHDRGEGFFADEEPGGSRGEGIFGQFYGPNHEEVGGLFNRDDIAGVFAARRDE